MVYVLLVSTTYPANEIQCLKTWEAIRKRPSMYLGDMSNPGVVNTVLDEALSMVRWQLLEGDKITEVKIVADGLQFRIEDNGPGWPTDMVGNKRVIERWLTDVGSSRHHWGVPVAVALSKYVYFETTTPALQTWVQELRDGIPFEPLKRRYLQENPRPGTVLMCRLDPDFFPPERSST